jgi:acetyl esterase/lipase
MYLQRLTRCALVFASGLLAACSNLLFGIANAPTYVGSQLRAHDARYGSQPRQELDVYAPEQARDAPVVVFWHGGSWATGDKASYRFVGDALAKQGIVAVLPNYRLHPTVQFPAFMDDAALAVAWIREHARDYGGAADRIVLMGHSAGAQIATLLAYDSRYLERVAVHADWQPLAFATMRSPPTLLIHGLGDDVVRSSHAQRLRDALDAAGASVEMELYAQAGHAATVSSFAWLAPSRLPVLERSIQFIRSVSEK